MKKLIIRTIAALILMLGIILVSPAYGQNGDPPPPPGGHGSTQNEPPGGGAPVGSGLAILLALGAAYGGKKMYEIGRKPASR
jgi:drug/metabolite transporter (DMT)-like permease